MMCHFSLYHRVLYPGIVIALTTVIPLFMRYLDREQVHVLALSPPCSFAPGMRAQQYCLLVCAPVADSRDRLSDSRAQRDRLSDGHDVRLKSVSATVGTPLHSTAALILTEYIWPKSITRCSIMRPWSRRARHSCRLESIR